jgi:hypothetical protein
MPDSPLAFTARPGLELPPPRTFGAATADLDLDFGWVDRPALVTAVLAGCCAKSEAASAIWEEAAWSLPLGARILRLLQIVELTTQKASLTITSSCPQIDCHRPLEMVLPYAQLAAYASSENAPGNIVQFPRADATPHALRLPTGRDQAAWQSQTYQTPDEALAAIVRSLLTASDASSIDLSGAHLEPLAAIMEQADPLVSLSVSVTCPHCAHDADLPLDLEAVALQQLAQHQRALLRDVHEIARHYGWSEGEVLAVSAQRRAQYRRLIAAEETSPL